MRRSNFIIKLVSLVLFIAIASYIGFYIYHSMANPFQTTLAANLTVEVSGEVTGYVIRNETVLSASDSNISITASEGSRVAVGQELAIEYSSAQALQKATEIRTLQLQIAQLESICNAENITSSNSAAESILQLSNAVQHRDFSQLDELSLDIETRIFSNGQSVSIVEAESELSALTSQLDALRTGSDSDISFIYAGDTGLFSSSIDGFESVNPSALKNLTPENFASLFSTPDSNNEKEFGKLVYGISWYYAAIMDSEDAAQLSVGKKATLQFNKTYNADLKMTVESIGTPSNGTCIVVFSCTNALSDIISTRTLTADIIFDTYTGIRVPKEAVRLNEDGNACIYILTGIQAEMVPVDILYESEDYYIVESGSVSGSSLRIGSEIIVRANDLFDGKVVQ